MKKITKTVLHILAIFILTILTQIGGVVYFVSMILGIRLKLGTFKSLVLFFLSYLIVTMLLLPLIVPVFGRIPLPVYGELRPLNLATCLLNRHYVEPELRRQLQDIAKVMRKEFDGTVVNYLDANFPFFDGFPLFPHLSHNDGKKVDLAFCYEDVKLGKMLNSAPSFIGYGIYDGPKEYEMDTPKLCKESGYWQYEALSYLIPAWNGDTYIVDVERTSTLVRLLAEHDLTAKIFIEPHLKERWKLGGYDKIRFQGCHSVRHDDHLHTQIY